MGGAVLIGKAEVAIEPGGAIAGELGDRAGAFVGGPEIIEGEFEGRFEGFEWPGLSGRAGHVEDAERVVGEMGVSPGPEFFATVDGSLDAVATEDPAFFPIEMFAEFLALGEDAGSGETAEAFGDDGAVDLDLVGAAGSGSGAEAMKAEAISRELVAIAGKGEPRFAVHELGGIDGDESGVVGDEGEVVRGGELDEGDGPAVLAIDDFDLEGFGESDNGEEEKNESEALHDEFCWRG